MIVSLFDEDDKLIMIDKKAYLLKNKQRGVLIDFELPESVENYYIKTFIWNSFDEIKPLTKATLFPKNGA